MDESPKGKKRVIITREYEDGHLVFKRREVVQEKDIRTECEFTIRGFSVDIEK